MNVPLLGNNWVVMAFVLWFTTLALFMLAKSVALLAFALLKQRRK